MADDPDDLNFPNIGAEFSREFDPEYILTRETGKIISNEVKEIAGIYFSEDTATKSIISRKLDAIKQEIILHQLDRENLNLDKLARQYIRSIITPMTSDQIQIGYLFSLNNPMVSYLSRSDRLGLCIIDYDQVENKLCLNFVLESSSDDTDDDFKVSFGNDKRKFQITLGTSHQLFFDLGKSYSSIFNQSISNDIAERIYHV